MVLEKLTPDFLIDADNVYRTKSYIVKQVIQIIENDIEDNGIVSHDTYYRRTTARDLAYNMAFMDKTKINGKRIYPVHQKIYRIKQNRKEHNHVLYLLRQRTHPNQRNHLPLPPLQQNPINRAHHRKR